MARIGLIRLLLGVIAVFFISSYSYALDSECYEACGDTLEEARQALASQISVDVQSEVEVKKSKKTSSFTVPFISGWLLSDSDSQTTLSTSQKVNLTLVNAKIVSQESRNGKVCLKMCRKDLVNYTNDLLEKTKNYYSKNLPAYEKAKKETVNEWLSEIELAKNLCLILSGDIKEKSALKRLIAQEKDLKDISSRLFEQYVIVNCEFSNVLLKINGKIVKTGDKIFLPAGEHRYILSVQGYCDKRGSFMLGNSEEKVIKVEPEPYPEITIASNKPGALLKIGGSSWTLGKPRIIEKCEGELPYSVEFAGEKKTGTIKLEPGLKKTEKTYLFSDQEFTRLKEMSSVFTRKNSIEIGYAFSVPGSDYEDLENIHKLNLRFYKNFRFLRAGAGAAYGGTEESSSGEIYLSLLFQLSEIGSRERPLHFFGLFPVIPFAGIDAGLGYHDLYDEKLGEKVDKFPTEDEPEEDDFKRDNLLLRARGGFNIPVNKNIGLVFDYGKNFYMEKASEFGASLVFSF
ncbi:MAG: hypothetical protein AB7E04_04770 [Desulfobacteraceae bacterium]